MTWRRVDHEALLRASGDDPYVELAIPRDCLAVLGEHGWAAMHPWRPTGHWGGAAIVDHDAPPDTESQALEALLRQSPDTPLEWFSTRAGRELTAPENFRITGGGSWDFLSTRQMQPVPDLPRELRLVELDDAADAAQLEEFGRGHNPEFEGFPGHGYGVLWLGLRDAEGALVGIGGMHLLAAGAPHLSGIVVDRAQRGRGLGRALTVELTRRALERAGFSTLGVFSANAPALSLYHALGYASHHSFHTRVLVRR